MLSGEESLYVHDDVEMNSMQTIEKKHHHLECACDLASSPERASVTLLDIRLISRRCSFPTLLLWSHCISVLPSLHFCIVKGTLSRDGAEYISACSSSVGRPS